MKAALVHEWLVTYAGSEKVLAEMCAVLPEAPVHTLVADIAALRNTPLQDRRIVQSGFARLPGAVKRYRTYLPLMPFAIEQFDLRDYDLIVSSSHAVAKGTLIGGNQVHVSYVHSPIRYAWDLYHQYLQESGLERGPKATLAKLILHYLRLWDTSTANRVDVFLANSQYVARRVWRTYRRPAHVVYPPVDVDRFVPGQRREEFYLTMSRFVPYKKIDLIVETFARLGKPLVVIGDGPDRAKIEALAGPTVTMLGRQPDEVVANYMSRCRAFVFAADEDFGITPVEAQAAGAPVIAYGRGGVLESVVEGRTGLFFEHQQHDSLASALERFEDLPRMTDSVIRRNAERFSEARFRAEFSGVVETAYGAFRAGLDPEQAVLAIKEPS